jgi:hypothetical protein
MRCLRRIFGPKREEVTRDWRSLHNGELYDLYRSPNIIWVIKPRTRKWVGHLARMREKRDAYRILVRDVRERDHWRDPVVDRKII